MVTLTIVRLTRKSLLAIVVAAALAVAPGAFLADLELGVGSALAKGGNGGGNGGGNAGGNGGGNAGGNAGTDSETASAGNSASAPGHNKSELGTPKNELGSLNASNASATARANASATSRVGMLGAYETALANGDVEAAAQALAGAANKAITPEVVAEVNQNLGIESTPEEEQQVADMAEAARTAEPVEEEEDEVAEEPTEEEEEVAEGDTDTVTEEEGEIASAADDLIGEPAAQ
jgi:hypothetical protein